MNTYNISLKFFPFVQNTENSQDTVRRPTLVSCIGDSIYVFSMGTNPVLELKRHPSHCFLSSLWPPTHNLVIAEKHNNSFHSAITTGSLSFWALLTLTKCGTNGVTHLWSIYISFWTERKKVTCGLSSCKKTALNHHVFNCLLFFVLSLVDCRSLWSLRSWVLKELQLWRKRQKIGERKQKKQSPQFRTSLSPTLHRLQRLWLV